MSRKKNAGDTGVRSLLSAALARAASITRQFVADGKSKGATEAGLVNAVAGLAAHLPLVSQGSHGNPFVMVSLRDVLHEALQAYQAGRVKHFAEAFVRWLAEGGGVVPVSPRAVREMLVSGGADGEGFTSSHGNADDATGRCCELELTLLAGSLHYTAPSVQELVNQGRLADASTEADILDVGLVAYVLTDALVPLVDGANEELAEVGRVHCRGQGLYGALVEPSPAITIEANDDADAIARLIGEGGPDVREIPPTMS